MCCGMKVSVNPDAGEVVTFHLQGLFVTASVVQSFADFDDFSVYQKHLQISDIQKATTLVTKF